VYQEVENRIAAFRSMLEKKLMQLPSSVDEQKKIIRYLLHLEVKGDPSWDCLVAIHKWQLELIENCSKEHIEKGKTNIK
jgi:exocyst complex component 2